MAYMNTRDPVQHLKAGHDVRAYWPTDTIGHLAWVEDETQDAGGYVDVFDTISGEPGETNAAGCITCGLDDSLNIEGLNI